MIGKYERVIDYIAGLEAGEKVSVRALAKTMNVSEGTAYKSIKQAEAQGLVITKPKVGTVRINLRSINESGDVSLAEAARSIGAVCVSGAEIAAEMPMPYMLLGDGGEKQFMEALRRAGGKAMAVMGDRPELQRLAVEQGCHLFLTGGGLPDKKIMEIIEKKKLCLFVSEQDSSTLLGMLNRRFPNDFSNREMSSVRDWMQLPRYLYHDDMVTEWYRLYSEMFHRGSSCSVVDDRLKICGSVEAMTAMNSGPALRLEEIMDPPEEGSFVDEDMSMEELAEHFIKHNRLFASVNSSDGMSGFIAASDVLRYYMYSSTSRFFDRDSENRLQIISDETGGERRMYTLQLRDIAEQFNRGSHVGSICSAAAWHAFYLLGGAVEFESGSMNSLDTPERDGEYLISSTLLKRTEEEVLLELEMYNDKASYVKASFRYRKTAEQES